MELLPITADNLSTHLESCLRVQTFLKEGRPSDPEQFKRTVQETGNYLVGAFEEGVLAGLGLVTRVVHPVTSVAYINNIVVSEDFRGRGLFSAIMTELERKAAEWGCSKVELTCSRPAVQPLYEKRGYHKRETNVYVREL